MPIIYVNDFTLFKFRSSLEKYRQVRVSESEGIPVRTLHYWVKRFSEKGMSGLERAKRKDSGSSRVLFRELKELSRGWRCKSHDSLANRSSLKATS